MNLLLFNFHDVVLLITMVMFFTIGISHIHLASESRLAFVSLALFCFASAAIPFDILISFGAGFREFAVREFPHLFYIFDMGYWVQAPLWYVFLKVLFNQKKSLSWVDIALFMPFLFFVLHQTVTFYFLSASEKATVLNGHHPSSFSIQYVTLLREVMRMIVFGLCLAVLSKHITSSTKNQDRRSFIAMSPWPIPLTFALFALSCVSVIDILLIMFSENGYSVFANTLGLTSNYVTLIILIITNVIAINSERIRIKGTSTTLKQVNTIDQKHVNLIEKAMTEEKLYMENDLNLETLAKHIGLPSRTVSIVINRHFNCNFFEFVNRYRIIEAKRMMEDEQFSECNILDIMLETGFNNKATFNTFFKKSLGMTPREYRKSQTSMPN